MRTESAHWQYTVAMPTGSARWQCASTTHIATLAVHADNCVRREQLALIVQIGSAHRLCTLQLHTRNTHRHCRLAIRWQQ